MSLIKNIVKVVKHSLVATGLVGIILTTLASCGESKGHFKIEGRFLHINSGELFVYSPDGIIDGLDTIKIQDGRFALEVPCHEDGLLMVVFPNFSQHPIFAESGGSVEISADASHLKEMEIKGTETNELMTKFRKSIAKMSPPEEKHQATLFIKDHPESPVSIYLTRKYFVDDNKPDVKQAQSLIAVMMKAQKKNVALATLKRQVDLMAIGEAGKSLPKFSATSIDGKTLTNADLNAPVAVVSVWASWSFESIDGQRAIKDALEKSGGKMKAISISIDGNKRTCLNCIKNYKISWPVVFDGTMINSKLMKQLGMTTVPENIILKNGKIYKSGLNTAQLRKELEAIYHI